MSETTIPAAHTNGNVPTNPTTPAPATPVPIGQTQTPTLTPPRGWAEVLKLGPVVAVVLTVAASIGGAFIAMQTTVGRLDARVDGIRTDLEKRADGTLVNNEVSRLEEDIRRLRSDKADSAVMLNAMNTVNTDIANVREQVSTTTANHTNLSNAYHLSTGRVETGLRDQCAEVASLKTEVMALGKMVARHDVTVGGAADDIKQVKNVTQEKLLAEVAALRDRVTKLEALIAAKNSAAKE